MLTGQRILITGVTGKVAEPLARHLARENEVWGIARFSDPAKRRSLEEAGIATRVLDVGSGDYSGLPDNFTYVIHLGFLRAGLADLEHAIRINVEGPGLLMQHCRKAKAHLIMSGMPVYTPNPDPRHLFTETDSIGASSYAYAPTSPYSKAGVEAVARTCARAFNVPVTIARANTIIGGTRCMAAQVVRSVLAGRAVQAPADPNMHSPLPIEDILWQIEPLLEAATVPGFVVNWGGDEHSSLQDWVARINQWSGSNVPVEVAHVPGAPLANAADPARRLSVTGPCRKDYWEALRAVYDEVVALGDEGRDPASEGIVIRR